jgi:hypothetical protein
MEIQRKLNQWTIPPNRHLQDLYKLMPGRYWLLQHHDNWSLFRMKHLY